MARLHLGYQSGEHLADVLLMLAAHRCRQIVGSAIPHHLTTLLMGKDAHGLPAIGQQHKTSEYLLYAKTIVSLDSLAGVD